MLALLAFLVVEAGRPQRRETLAELLWPDHDPRAARHSLSQALFCLRQLLDDSIDQPLLLLTRTSVQFAPATDHWVDVDAFQSLLNRRRRHHPSRGVLCVQCATSLQQAVELYRGDFLAQLSLPDAPEFDEWVLQCRAAFLHQTVGAMDDLIDYHDRRGELDEAASYARRQLALDPLREESHRHLMRLLARRGERGAALAQYEQCRQLLRDEMGVEPDAATTRLHQRLRDRVEGSSAAAPANARQPPRGELPDSPTPFVGRNTEVARLTELIFATKARLVTIVGPGGIGKTRLALQAAAPAVETFADGVVFVPLAGV
ncbi:MAG TPA: BTAD domain-containing putative transcriptional regulator, partial [Acidimicrobiales bacterium]|nr:BTAD domain-containing putative transcriptional regulator [Acidimicrobiales bacterium]